MKKNSRIIISGAGIAGLTAAIWLSKAGYKVTIIEKSPEIRADGYIVSLSHKSFHYAREMGILDKLMKRYSGIRESCYIDQKGREMLGLDYQKLFTGIDIVQVMRDELQNILYEHSKKYDIEFIFSQSIDSLNNHTEGVDITLQNRANLSCDILIGADGLHSITRKLAFNDNDYKKRYFGLFSAAYRLENVLDLHNRFENHMEQSRYMCVYTTGKGDLACVFIWKNTAERTPAPENRYEALKQAFSDSPKLVQTVLNHCPQHKTMYMDPLIQIDMPDWHKGNVVLLGDAAHTMTLLSGQGASTAFWGASSLSQALIENSPQDAFKQYQQELMPAVLAIQASTQNAKKWYIPDNFIAYTLRDSMMRYLPNQFFQSYFRSKYSTA